MKKNVTIDPVVQEVRQIRAKLSAKFGDDLQAIAADLRVRQRSNPRLVLARPAKRTV